MTTRDPSLRKDNEERGVLGSLLQRLLIALGRATESIIAVALVLVCFLVFLGILSFSFPRGTNLADLMKTQSSIVEGKQGPRLDFGLSESERESKVSAFAALLRSVFRQVKDKPAGSIVWEDARAGIVLKDRHAVQSFDRSGATIFFDDDNQLHLGENSLVVIRALERERRSERRFASLLVLDGNLRGSIGGARANAMRVDVSTATSTVTLDSAGSKNSDFKVSVNPDKSSTFAIYSGRAAVSVGGQRLWLDADHAVTVDASGKLGTPVALPRPTTLIGPNGGASYAFNNSPPKVRFGWEQSDDVDAYRLVLARDPSFVDVVTETDLHQPDFQHGNLSAGLYYWRVSGLEGQLEGAPSETRAIEIVKDVVPPSLRVQFPTIPVPENRFLLEGLTEPGSDVFVGDTQIDVMQSGEFAYSVPLERGLNVIVVEAVDHVGNTTFESRLINAKF